MRDMYITLNKNGLGMPFEAQVEQHLMSRLKNGIMKEGVLFPYVYCCAPLNSQEKYAERLISDLKTSRKISWNASRRFYAKREAMKE